MKKGILILLMILLGSCAGQKRGLYPEGTILKAERDRVFVLFEDAYAAPGTYGGEWFYFPGIGLINKDDYCVQVTLIKRKP